LDAFKIVVTLALVFSLATLGAIVLISVDAIDNAKIPDITRGTVTSKAPVTDSHPADYEVALAENQVLYIQNNTVLYERIQVNQTYLFDCRIDFNNKMTIIENATLILL
jgi:hypothetical protein